MGRTTSILISKNTATKTHQTQTIWFGDGEIRLNGETGTYIGKYAKNGGWWNAEVHFAGEIYELSQPTATQAAQEVAWAWLACKALEVFAAAAAPVLELMEEEYWQAYKSFSDKLQDAILAEEEKKTIIAQANWKTYSEKGGWWFAAANNNADSTNKILVFNAAENVAFFTTPAGELHREVDAEPYFLYVCNRWIDVAVSKYIGEIWAYYFHANCKNLFNSNNHCQNSFADNVELFKKVVPFDELETAEQVYAWLTITEAESYAAIPDSILRLEFRWKLSFYKYPADFIARPDEERTIIADCK